MSSDQKLFLSPDIADAYQKYRPDYPAKLKEEILNYVKEDPNATYDFAVDIACGSGQSTLMWADHYKLVYGTDISKPQIDMAPKNIANVKFKVGTAENLEFDDNSVDLLTIGQAMHWTDVDKFYAEVKRVLKPNGVFATYGYGMARLPKEEATLIVTKELFEDALGGYWYKGLDKLIDNYAEYTPLPFKNFKRVDDLEIRKEGPLDHFMGYLSSWSGYRAYMREHPGSTLLETVHKRMREIFKDEESVIVTWPAFLLLGRK